MSVFQLMSANSWVKCFCYCRAQTALETPQILFPHGAHHRWYVRHWRKHSEDDGPHWKETGTIPPSVRNDGTVPWWEQRWLPW